MHFRYAPAREDAMLLRRKTASTEWKRWTDPDDGVEYIVRPDGRGHRIVSVEYDPRGDVKTGLTHRQRPSTRYEGEMIYD
jgi:hypothetical protein